MMRNMLCERNNALEVSRRPSYITYSFAIEEIKFGSNSTYRPLLGRLCEAVVCGV